MVTWKRPRGERRSRRLSALWLVGLEWLVFCLLTLGCPLPVRTDLYVGDGRVSRISFPPNPGVRVDFEDFQLSKAYQGSYRLNGLPIHSSHYVAELILPITLEDRSRKDSKFTPIVLGAGSVGQLTIRARSESGGLLFDCTGSLTDLYWAWDWLEYSAIGFFNRPSSDPRASLPRIYPSEIPLEEKVSIVLEVSYDPEPDAPDRVAHIRLRAGGQK